MKEYKTVEGSIVNASETYIVHQCNCVTKRGKGLSYTLFNAFPDANIYKLRTENSKPGTIDVRGKVINLFGQVNPGHAGHYRDTEVDRLAYFKSCIEELRKLDGSFAFPYKIGCGLAGGDWSSYEPMIRSLSRTHDVTIYKLPGSD